MGRKWSSIAARESAWLPSYPTRLPSSSNWAAIAGASCWFQAMRISSYRRRIGWSDETVLVLDIQNNSFHLTLYLREPIRASSDSGFPVHGWTIPQESHNGTSGPQTYSAELPRTLLLQTVWKIGRGLLDRDSGWLQCQERALLGRLLSPCRAPLRSLSQFPDSLSRSTLAIRLHSKPPRLVVQR